MARMLLRAVKLRTPSHSCPALPFDFSMSKENALGSDLNSQYCMAPLLSGFRLVERPAPRPDLGGGEQAGLAVGVRGQDRRGFVLVGRLDHDETAVGIALVVEKRPGEFQRAFGIEPLEEGDVRRA